MIMDWKGVVGWSTRAIFSPVRLPLDFKDI